MKYLMSLKVLIKNYICDKNKSFIHNGIYRINMDLIYRKKYIARLYIENSIFLVLILLSAFIKILQVN